MELDGKVAIVTGASRGVGAATAVALAAAGCRVACAARATEASPQPTPGTLDETVRRISDAGGTALAVPTNLAVDGEVEAMVASTIEVVRSRRRPGEQRGDHLPRRPRAPDEAPRPRVRGEPARHRLLAIQAVVPGMRERGEGSILNVSSVAALNYFPGLMAYGMSKIAMEHMTVSARGPAPGRRHRRQHLPHRHPGRVGGVPRERARGRPLRLGTERGRGGGHPLDAGPARVLHRAQRGHGRAPGRARDHAQSSRRRAPSGGRAADREPDAAPELTTTRTPIPEAAPAVRPRAPARLAALARLPRRDADAVEPTPGPRRLRHVRRPRRRHAVVAGPVPRALDRPRPAPPARQRRAPGVLPTGRGRRARNRRSRCPAGTAPRESCSTSSCTGRCGTSTTSRTTAARSPACCSTSPRSSSGPSARRSSRPPTAPSASTSADRPRRGPDGRPRYGWDERLRVSSRPGAGGALPQPGRRRGIDRGRAASPPDRVDTDSRSTATPGPCTCRRRTSGPSEGGAR